MELKKIKSGAGFTLIEILVVLFIVLLLSTITLASYRSGEKQYQLQRSIYKLAQGIRMTQEMAMSAKECCGGQIPSRYGLYISDEAPWHKGYQIFADFDDDGLYDSGDQIITDTGVGQNYEGDVIYKAHRDLCTLPNNSFKFIHWTFKPPDPETYIIVSKKNADHTDPAKYVACSQVRIFLQTGAQAGQPEKWVMINGAGMIEIQ